MLLSATQRKRQLHTHSTSSSFVTCRVQVALVDLDKRREGKKLVLQLHAFSSAA